MILIPEGILEFIPEMRSLILELNQLIAKGLGQEALSLVGKELFLQLPEKIQKQLLLERDPHGNVALSQIETESLLIELVKRACPGKFSFVPHFFGYEGRSCFPSNFDANYCYSLGLTAALACRDGATGVICAIKNLKQGTEHWTPRLIPIVQLMGMEERNGKQKPVIKKALVDLEGKSFSRFAEKRGAWELEDFYLQPGPMQFFGDSDLVNSVPSIL